MKCLLPALLLCLATGSASAGLVRIDLTGTILVTQGIADAFIADGKPFSASFVIDPAAQQTVFVPASGGLSTHSEAGEQHGCSYYQDGLGCVAYKPVSGPPVLVSFSISTPYWPQPITRDFRPGAPQEPFESSGLYAARKDTGTEAFFISGAQYHLYQSSMIDDGYFFTRGFSLGFEGTGDWIPDMHDLSRLPDLMAPDLQVSFAMDDRLECMRVEHCYLRFQVWSGENLEVSVTSLQETPEPSGLALLAAGLLALRVNRRHARIRRRH